jgi:hypothetical protein
VILEEYARQSAKHAKKWLRADNHEVRAQNTRKPDRYTRLISAFRTSVLSALAWVGQHPGPATDPYRGAARNDPFLLLVRFTHPASQKTGHPKIPAVGGKKKYIANNSDLSCGFLSSPGSALRRSDRLFCFFFSLFSKFRNRARPDTYGRPFST